MNAPVSGEIIEVNEKIVDDTSILNQDPYGEGWIAKIEIDNEDEVKNLMNSKEYSEYRKE